MGLIYNISESIKNSAFNVLREPFKKIFTDKTEAFEKESIIPYVYATQKMTTYRDVYRAFTSMDGFKPTEDAEIPNLSDFEESYEKEFRTIIWTNAFSISKQTMEDGQLTDAAIRATKFIKSYGRTKELYAVNMLGAALGTVTSFEGKAISGKGADTVDGGLESAKQQYFHNAHKTVALQDGSTPVEQSNKFYANLTFNGTTASLPEKVLDIIGQVASKMSLYVDDKGGIIGATPTRIVIGEDYALKNALMVGLKSLYGSEMGANGINLKYGKWDVIVSPYLSQVTGFRDADKGLLLIDPAFNQEELGAVWSNRTDLEINSYTDNATKVMTTDGRARFGVNFLNFRAMSYISLNGNQSTNATALTPVVTSYNEVKAEIVNNELNPVIVQKIEPVLGDVTITSVYGGEANASTITITSEKNKPNNTFFYKADASSVAAPEYGDDTTGWTAMTLVDNAQNITFATQTKIRVAEVNVAGEIIKVSAETTIVKSEA